MIKVIKRERKLKKSTALYLDYRIDGVRVQEATGLHIYPAKDERTKQLNKDNLLRFEKLRVKKENDLLNNRVALPVNKKKGDFFSYYNDYFVRFPTKERRASAVLNKLKLFYPKSILPFTIVEDESFLVRFKGFLEDSLSGETPHNYFKLFCKVVKHATKEGIFANNPAADIRMKRKEGIPKEVLTMDELKVLAGAGCINVAVKSAFIFSCFTGLRYCDVSRLRWKHISEGKVSMTQAKTGYNVTVDLHEIAVRFLPVVGRPDDLVFALPTTLNGCNKVLKEWVVKSGVNKKITWHCGRHTFGTNLIFYGANILVASSLMGQRSVKYTQRYIRIADSMKEKQIQLLPTF